MIESIINQKKFKWFYPIVKKTHPFLIFFDKKTHHLNIEASKYTFELHYLCKQRVNTLYKLN